MRSDKSKFAIILFNNGGGGHLSAAMAVKNTLESIGYEVEISEIIKGVFSQEKFSKTGENRFDYYFNTEKWFKLKLLVMMQFFADLILLFSKKNFIKERITKKCNGRKLDLLVSVFPVGTACYQKITRDLNIPFLVVPTDLKTDFFFNFVDKESKNNRMFAALPYDDPKIERRLDSKNIQAFTTDYPIRHDFEVLARVLREEGSENKKLQELKNLNGIRENDRSVLISIGAKGFAKESYVQYIQAINENIDEFLGTGEVFHIFAATGSSLELYQSLLGILGKLDLRLRLHVLNFLDASEMALHLKLVNAVISKPGGGIVAEAIASGVPMILKSDSTKSLPWEKTNMNFIEKNRWGVALKAVGRGEVSRKDFLFKLKMVLNSGSNNSFGLDMPRNNFSEKFSRLVLNLH